MSTWHASIGNWHRKRRGDEQAAAQANPNERLSIDITVFGRGLAGVYPPYKLRQVQGYWGRCVLYSGNQRRNDIITLRGIIRGPGNYATPSPDRVDRLMKNGLVRKTRGKLRPTLKGRLIALFSRER